MSEWQIIMMKTSKLSVWTHSNKRSFKMPGISRPKHLHHACEIKYCIWNRDSVRPTQNEQLSMNFQSDDEVKGG